MRVNRLFFLLSSYRPSLLSPRSARRSEATPPRAGAALEATSEAWLARMAVRHTRRAWSPRGARALSEGPRPRSLRPLCCGVVFVRPSSPPCLFPRAGGGSRSTRVVRDLYHQAPWNPGLEVAWWSWGETRGVGGQSIELASRAYSWRSERRVGLQSIELAAKAWSWRPERRVGRNA